MLEMMCGRMALPPRALANRSKLVSPAAALLEEKITNILTTLKYLRGAVILIKVQIRKSFYSHY